MKKFFYLGILGLILFEVAHVYFIMPMPGSQRMNSINLAYFLHKWRWIFRAIFVIMMVAGLPTAWRASKVFSIIFLLLTGIIIYASNFMMAADAMFKQPKNLGMAAAADNKVLPTRLILGVSYNGQAKAYPIQYLGYHHQVFDTLGGKPVIVTYCTVCRTGRVFEPLVKGKTEKFRLVGMDHFNAMFEDKTTRSWWRQATGEAIAGKLKGEKLPEVSSVQMSLQQWLRLYPQTLIMQPDDAFIEKYEGMEHYESGNSKNNLTRRDSASWQEKSWVVGLVSGSESKAYDWNRLTREHVILDVLNNKPVAIVLAGDDKSFAAFRRVSNQQQLSWVSDTLTDGQNKYNLLGESYTAGVPPLERINAYQEYWHSWQTFHPGTKKY